MSALSRRSRRAVPLVLTVAGFLIATAPAHAGTVSMSGPAMSFVAAAGEANDVNAVPGPTGVLFTDTGAPLAAGVGCGVQGAGVFCAYTDVPSETTIELDLLDGNDRGSVDDLTGNILRMSVFGGSGNDEAHVGGGSPNFAVADGGPGNDSLNSAMNFTGTLTVEGGPGNDELRAIELGRRSLLAGNDGADRIVIAPVVTPPGPLPVFDGGPGNDTIVDNSGGSAGQIVAGRGFDTLSYAGVQFGGGNIDLAQCPTCSLEKIVGSDFDDTLQGDAGSTLFLGRGGADLIEPRGGVDVVSAGAGADRVHVGGDHRTDIVSCGPDPDDVTADRFDIVARDCETVAR